MQEARLLVSRLESLENFVKQHHVQFDAKSTSKSLMKLRITSDILFTKRNFTNDKTGLPGNVRVNIELKNTAPMIQHSGAFLVNSTVHLFDRSKVAKSQNSGTTESILRDGATKQQVRLHCSDIARKKPFSLEGNTLFNSRWIIELYGVMWNPVIRGPDYWLVGDVVLKNVSVEEYYGLVVGFITWVSSSMYLKDK